MDMLGQFPAILQYGSTGLSALLFFFAFILLLGQSKKTSADKAVLGEIRRYMYFAVAMTTISLLATVISPAKEGLERNTAKTYVVSGSVTKSDQLSPRDVIISHGWPIYNPTDKGDIVSLEVWTDPHEKFPELTFSAPGYMTDVINLNNKNKVDISEEDFTIRIKNRVILDPIRIEN